MRDEAQEYHAATYAPIIATLKRIYSENSAVLAQLDVVEIFREDWDLDGCGGHFKMRVAQDTPPIEELYVVECDGLDADGGPIQILMHTVAGRLHWGEWYKSTLANARIENWPPIVMGDSLEISNQMRTAPNRKD